MSTSSSSGSADRRISRARAPGASRAASASGSPWHGRWPSRRSVLLLDEPLAALDPSTRSAVAAELARVIERAAVPTIVVTHSYEEAVMFADEVAVMDRGAIVQRGRAAEVVEAPASAFVAEFAGINYLTGTAAGTTVSARPRADRANHRSRGRAGRGARRTLGDHAGARRFRRRRRLGPEPPPGPGRAGRRRREPGAGVARRPRRRGDARVGRAAGDPPGRGRRGLEGDGDACRRRSARRAAGAARSPRRLRARQRPSSVASAGVNTVSGDGGGNSSKPRRSPRAADRVGLRAPARAARSTCGPRSPGPPSESGWYWTCEFAFRVILDLVC